LKEALGIKVLPSYTTRPMRENESQGNPYMFVSKEEFERHIEEGEMLEHEEVHPGIYYGAHKHTYEYAIENGYDGIKDIDVDGMRSMKKALGNNVVTIFVKTSTIDILRDRIIKRHEDDETQIANRLSRAEYELERIPEYDYVVVNDNLETAKVDFINIIKSEMNK